MNDVGNGQWWWCVVWEAWDGGKGSVSQEGVVIVVLGHCLVQGCVWL